MPDRERNDDTRAESAHAYERHLARIRGDRDCLASNGCQYCETTLGFIERIWTYEGTKPLLCEDCAKQVRSLESLADELASAPGCEERQQILDTAETTAEVVDRLLPHDLERCAACASAHSSAAVGGARKVV